MVDSTSLTSIFEAHASEDVRAAIGDAHTFEQSLRSLVHEARAEWPGIEIDDPLFVAYVAQRIQDAPATALAEVCGSDLYLACACLRGDRSAIDALERTHLAGLRSALDRILPSAGQSQEVMQTLLQQWLTGRDDRPGTLAQYAGQGRLNAWLRVTAVREAVRVRRKGQAEQPSEDRLFDALPSDNVDPELRYMKELYRKEFREAFVEALGSLNPKERTLLRHALVDGLTVDQVGSIYGVHRSSSARWIAEARNHLLDRTRSGFMRRIGVGFAEQQSILRLIESQLDISVRVLLGPDDAAPSGPEPTPKPRPVVHVAGTPSSRKR